MTDYRKRPRQCLDAPGRIQFAFVTTRKVECIVHDIGEGGARLQTLSVAGIPSEFELQVEDTVYNCFVRWRKQRMLGVEFLPSSMRAL